MFEHKDQPLLPKAVFYRRLITFTGFALGIVLFSWGIGALGYHFLEGLSWIDALLNAAMLLGGEGPVTPLHTTAGKLFASFYALFSGLIILVAVGVIFTPLFHRFLHRFHLEFEDDDGDEDKK
jgi:hypothetical protein